MDEAEIVWSEHEMTKPRIVARPQQPNETLPASRPPSRTITSRTKQSIKNQEQLLFVWDTQPPSPWSHSTLCEDDLIIQRLH
jgi:hypothetical protein